MEKQGQSDERLSGSHSTPVRERKAIDESAMLKLETLYIGGPAPRTCLTRKRRCTSVEWCWRWLGDEVNSIMEAFQIETWGLSSSERLGDWVIVRLRHREANSRCVLLQTADTVYRSLEAQL